MSLLMSSALCSRNVGPLWQASNRKSQRDFVLEVFDRIVGERDQGLELAPKAPYAPLFAIDRQERFGGDMCVVWLPGQDSNLRHGG